MSGRCASHKDSQISPKCLSGYFSAGERISVFVFYLEVDSEIKTFTPSVTGLSFRSLGDTFSAGFGDKLNKYVECQRWENS